jgi:DNA invertase Pin-like site-specific DNA recombinase
MPNSHFHRVSWAQRLINHLTGSTVPLVDTGTPAGKAMFQMLGVFSEFERAMIVERVKAGLSRARSQGKRLGRRPVNADVVERIRAQLATARVSSKRPRCLASAPGQCIASNEKWRP